MKKKRGEKQKPVLEKEKKAEAPPAFVQLQKPAVPKPAPAVIPATVQKPPQPKPAAVRAREPRAFTLYRGIARTLKENYMRIVRQHLDYAGIEEDADLWLGGRILVALLFGVVGFLLPWSLFVYLGWMKVELATITLTDVVFLYAQSIVFGSAFFFFTLFLYYMQVYYTIDDRAKRVERALPDFLLMIAANMRAGMTPFSAFHVSARPEFGPLEEIVRLVTAKTMGTESLAAAFEEMPKRVESDILRKMAGFFVKGMQSGGHLAKLLETSAEEIREAQELRQELVTSTRTYTIFLAFIVIFGIPLLLAISSQFIGTFAAIQEEQRGSPFIAEAGIAFFTGEVTLQPAFLFQASLVLLAATAFFVSILIGVISEGKLLYGVKYVIPIATASIVVFFVIRSVISGMLSVLGAPG